MHAHLCLAAVAFSLVAAGCTKTEGETAAPAPAASSVVAAAEPAPLGSTSTSLRTAIDAAAPATAAPAVATTPPSSASTDAKADASADAKADAKKAEPRPAAADETAAPECGTRPLPDCPLQAWMKTNANPPVMTKDTAALASALEKTALFAPPGYASWVSISKDGAAAARSGDFDAAKASCRSCHDQYKQKYKTEHRARKL